LIGNVLSLCKSFGFAVVNRLHATLDLRPTPVYVKKQKLLGFLGSLAINFQLGPSLGIGHLVSIGFGEVAASPEG
jgi:CRISPR/Cas system endoribonuclease Cas6 (RAMP superfamily)